MRILTMALVFVLTCTLSSSAGAQDPSASAASTQVQTMTHDAFIAIEARTRSDVFAKLTPENKSALKRAHAQAWLAKNKHRLSAKQIAVVQDAIAFLSPELYREPSSATMRTREEQVRHKLECALARNDVIEAFTFQGRNPAPTLSARVDEWLSWFGDCVAGGG